MDQCSFCNRRPTDFVEIQCCENCGAVELLPTDTAVDWIQATLSRHLDQIRNLLGNTAESLKEFLGLLDSLTVKLTNRHATVDFGAISAIDTLSRALEAPTESSRTAPSASLLLHLLREFAELRELGHDVAQGVRVLANGKAVERFYTARTYAPPVPLTRAREEWKRWTYLPFGAAPDLAKREPAFHDALVRDDPRSTIFAAAAAHGERVMPLNGLLNRQLFNRYAPRFTRWIAAAPAETRNAVLTLTDLLDEFAEKDECRVETATRTIAGVPSDLLFVEAARLGADIAIDPLTALPGQANIFPVLFPCGEKLLYSPKVVHQLAALSVSYVHYLDNRDLGHLASVSCERLISKLLERLGYATTIDGTRLVRIATKRGKMEIDVLAWRGNAILCVEVRNEFDPPGAWTQALMDARKAELDKEARKLQRKVSYWRDHLLRSRSIWISGTEVALPAGVGSKIAGIIVSTRLEPRLHGPPLPVVTFAPPLAKSILLQKLPKDVCSELWDGVTDIAACFDQREENARGRVIC